MNPRIQDNPVKQLKTPHILLMIAIGMLPSLFALIAWYGGVPMTEPVAAGASDHGLALVFKGMILSASITIAVLCFLQFVETGRLVKPLLAAPLLAGGVMELIQIGVLVGWLPSSAPAEVFLPMGWVVSDGLVIVWLCLLPTIFLITDTIRGRDRQRRATQWAVGITVALVAVSAGLLYLATERPGLQQAFAEGNGIAALIAWVPVLLCVALGAFILPTYTRWHPSIFAQTVMIACVPLGLSHVHVALAPNVCCGWTVFAANLAKLTAYLLPCLGLVLDYRWTFQSMREANQVLRDQVFMATQLAETAKGQQRSLQTLFDTIRQPVCFLDTSGRILKLNAMAASLCHVPSPQHAVGRAPSNVFPAELAALFAEGVSEAIRDQAPVSLSREWMSEADEPGSGIRWTFRPIDGDQGNTVGVMAIGSEQPVAAAV